MRGIVLNLNFSQPFETIMRRYDQVLFKKKIKTKSFESDAAN